MLRRKFMKALLAVVPVSLVGVGAKASVQSEQSFKLGDTTFLCDSNGIVCKSISPSCVKYYNSLGQLHREDGPAMEYAGSHKYWYINGDLHREDGPAIEYANGSTEWWIKGQLHREDGPAIEYSNGHKEWYFEGKRHRIGGPAIEYANGSGKWYIDGQYQSKFSII